MFFEIEPDPGPETPHIVRMVVEIPRDSSNKYEYDASLRLFKLSRTLYSPLHYPGDYGFIPGTVAEDHEPLDILCLVTSPSFTGCLTYVRPLAVLDMIDGEDWTIRYWPFRAATLVTMSNAHWMTFRNTFSVKSSISSTCIRSSKAR